MRSVSRLRWARAMMSVVAVERCSPALASIVRPATFLVAGAKAWRPDADLSELPSAVRPTRDGPSTRMRAPVMADLVAIARFNVRGVKLRSFYPEAGVSAWLHVGSANTRRVRRTLDAYRLVSRYVPELAPQLEDHGIALVSRGGYLVEELVNGVHPARTTMQKLVEPLAAQLLRLYRGVGLTSRPLSAVVHHLMMERWLVFAREARVDDTLVWAVRRLVERDALVEVSLGHGDLVHSNILVGGDRIVLVDWEYAGELPIAFDLAKVHLTALDPDVTQACLERGLEYSVGCRHGHYSFTEQLALAHVQMLSWHQVRQAKAEEAGRESFLATLSQKRVRAIARLLDVDAAVTE